MSINPEKFVAARRASGLSFAQAADAAGVSSATYQSREVDPAQFRLHEIAGVYRSLSDVAKPIFKDAVCDIFLT